MDKYFNATIEFDVEAIAIQVEHNIEKSISNSDSFNKIDDELKLELSSIIYQGLLDALDKYRKVQMVTR